MAVIRISCRVLIFVSEVRFQRGLSTADVLESNLSYKVYIRRHENGFVQTNAHVDGRLAFSHN